MHWRLPASSALKHSIAAAIETLPFLGKSFFSLPLLQTSSSKELFVPSVSETKDTISAIENDEAPSKGGKEDTAVAGEAAEQQRCCC